MKEWVEKLITAKCQLNSFSINQLLFIFLGPSGVAIISIAIEWRNSIKLHSSWGHIHVEWIVVSVPEWKNKLNKTNKRELLLLFEINNIKMIYWPYPVYDWMVGCCRATKKHWPSREKAPINLGGRSSGWWLTGIHPHSFVCIFSGWLAGRQAVVRCG